MQASSHCELNDYHHERQDRAQARRMPENSYQ
jgi:hypothetical protein